MTSLPQGPLDEILEGNTAVHRLRDALARQIKDSLESGTKFKFVADDEETQQALEEYHLQACAAESVLDDAVYHLAKTYMGPVSEDLSVTLLTKGFCPTLMKTLKQRPESYITRSLSVGHHIPTDKFQDLWLRSLTDRLSDKYRPNCSFCPPGKRKKKHPTVLSFMRYVPETLQGNFTTLDDSERNIRKLKYEVAMAENLPNEVRESGERLLNLEQNLEATKQREILRVSQELGYKVALASTRVKGDSRLAMKLIRYVTGTDVPDDDVSRLGDRNGMKIGVASDNLEDVEHIANTFQNNLSTLFGAKSILSPVKLEENYHEGVPVWIGYKLVGVYSSRGFTLPIQFQFQLLDHYYQDIADHPFYEERQQQELKQREESGIPINDIYNSLTSELKRARNRIRNQ